MVPTPSFFNYRGAALQASDYSAMLDLEREIKRPIPHLFDEGEVGTVPSRNELKVIREGKDVEDSELPWDVWYEELPWQGKGLNHHNVAFTTEGGCVTGLALTHLGLTKVPDAVFRLPQLTKFYLDGNKITILPNAIGSLRFLTELCIEENLVSTLPRIVTELQFLKDFGLLDAGLSRLPPFLAELPALQRVTINLPLPKSDLTIQALVNKGVEINARFGWHYDPSIEEVKEAICDYIRRHPGYDRGTLGVTLNITMEDEVRAIRELQAEGKIKEEVFRR